MIPVPNGQLVNGKGWGVPALIRWMNVLSRQSVAVSSKAADYTIGSSDAVMFIDCTAGNVTLTLPAANLLGVGSAVTLQVFRTDATANTLTVQRSGADTFIGGGISTTIAASSQKGFVSDSVSLWGIR